MNVPGDEKVLLKLAFGAILPEFHAPVSETDVCVVLSPLTHVTVVPMETVIGFGLNAVVVMVDAPATIVTDDPVPDGVGDGLVLVTVLIVEELPHPAASSPRTSMNRIRIPRLLL